MVSAAAEERTDAEQASTSPLERCTEPFFQLGDTVTARIIWANEKGARAELLQDRRLVGYIPVREMPYVVRKDVAEDTGHWSKDACLPVGLVREYEVVAVPDEMEYHGRGPMLSARRIDLNLLWRRADQILQTCLADKEVVRMKITEANTGGLLTTLESLPAFIPYSHVPKPFGSKLTSEEMAREYKDKEVIVSVAEVVPLHRKLMLSVTLGEHNLQLRSLEVGALVWGTVRRIEPFGLFLGLDKLKMSALLHISNMSRAHVADPADTFAIGERVRAIVVGMNPDGTRVSISTAELEPEDGDMLVDKEKVYAAADEQAKLFRDHLNQVEEEGAQEGESLEW
ncbi:hypothetical protein WJX81_001927 [Elliptochloris bilobata]|uniref:S1 motif domain-containing protein n=1 Tax=Elliptochloris bilobata TaxID=381761 RepID=A0AAW1SDL2_9CHLO